MVILLAFLGFMMRGKMHAPTQGQLIVKVLGACTAAIKAIGRKAR